MNIFTEKYRPTNLNDIKSQKHIITILDQIIETGNIENNILFYGRPGCGKTSAMLCFAKKYYGDNYKNMILELNASDDRGVNMVRNTISDFVDVKLFFNNKKKMIILDEADSMTIDAQNLLIKLMEENKNVIFCFICNYINKISLAITSRCLCFRFNNIKIQDMNNLIIMIAKNENIEIPNDTLLKDIYKFGKKDMRKCINIFQNIVENKKINTNIHKIFNYPTKEHIKIIIDTLTNNKICIKDSFNIINSLITNEQLILSKIINELTYYINTNRIINNVNKYIYILEKLGDIEYNLTNDFNQIIQIYSLISIFKKNIN
jgi:replication factor C subunit 3/5